MSIYADSLEFTIFMHGGSFEITITVPLIHTFVTSKAGVYILPFFESMINSRINLALNLSYFPKHFLTISAFPCFIFKISFTFKDRVSSKKKGVPFLTTGTLSPKYDYKKYFIKLEAKTSKLWILTVSFKGNKEFLDILTTKIRVSMKI